MNYLDLFSGIGGFALGIQQAGIKFDKHYFSEIDKYATQIYKRHFPDAVKLGDIKGIKPEALGEIDLVTFGFPCQDLSIAGKRKGLRGARGGLFFEAMRIIKELRPPVFIFENVKGLLTSNEGKDFEVVLREIADIGLYECEWQLVNTSWVLPQNRERVYFIGHFGKGSGQKVFPIGEGNKVFNQKSKHENICPSITSRYYKRGKTDPYIKILDGYNQNFTDKFGAVRQNMQDGGSLIFLGGIMGDKNKKWLEDGKDKSRNFPQGQRVYSPKGNSAQLTSQGGGWGAKTGLYAISPCIRSEHHNTADVHFIKENMKIRRLTPTECCRLQGFPDDWCNDISDTQKYKALGNAVSVPIVKMIIERLYNKPTADL